MADTFSERIQLIKMEIDSHENDWGDQLNLNFDKIDEAIGGQRVYATTGGTINVTETEIRSAFHRCTGLLTSNAVFQVPLTSEKLFIWRNECTGPFTVTVKVIGQVGVLVGQGVTKVLRNNGVDVIDTGADAGAAGLASYVGALTIGLADAYSVAANGSIPLPLIDGTTLTAFIDDVNTTATPTLNYGGTGALPIVHSDGSALRIGDMIDGKVATFFYKGGKWMMQTPGGAKYGANSAIAFSHTQPVNTYYRVMLAVPFPFKVTSVGVLTKQGTCTATFKLNGVDLGGGPSNATTTYSTVNHTTANTIAIGQWFDVVMSSVVNVLDFDAVIYIERTG